VLLRKSLMRATVAGLAVILTLTVTEGSALADPSSSSSAKEPLRLDPSSSQVAHPKMAGIPASITSDDDCAEVRKKLKIYAANGQKTVSCTEAPPAAQRRTAPTAKLAGVWCDGQAKNTWWLTRTSICISDWGPWTTNTVRTDNGQVIGSLSFNASMNIELNTISLSFSQSLTVVVTTAWGVNNLSTIQYLARCTSSCTVSDSAVSPPLTVGSVWNTTLYYQVSTTSQTSFNPQFQWRTVKPDGAVRTWGLNTVSSRPIRCDRLVGANPGCVIPTIRPTMFVSVAEWGSAAQNILFAQTVLPDKWGKSTPLRRLADPAIQNTNRAAICDSTFVPDPTVVGGDSCDEFAFAATYQSGNLLGQTGSTCAEIRPYIDQVTGTWAIAPAGRGWNGTERCVRGHVTLAENTGVGGQLGRFTTAERLLDYDEYWLTVTD